jgi:2-oxoglutarate ferredoxin oxidoreductase subunit beta
MNLNTKAVNTWCPGCTNFLILSSFKSAIEELVKEGKIKKDNVTVVSGIGCHGKISDYLNMNSFLTLHGREVPTMTGIKLGNKNLVVIGFTGDGSAYDEGIAHWIHAAKRNTDVTLLIHNNELFALTTGQATATSEKGFKGKSSPYGSPEEPLKPLALALESGATFVARSFALDLVKNKEIIKQAILHKGFSMVDILQPCISFYDNREELKKKIQWLDKKNSQTDFNIALKKIKEKDKISLGVFYQINKPVFEEVV